MTHRAFNADAPASGGTRSVRALVVGCLLAIGVVVVAIGFLQRRGDSGADSVGRYRLDGNSVILIVGASQARSSAAIRAAVSTALDAAGKPERRDQLRSLEVLVADIAPDASPEGTMASLVARSRPIAVIVAGTSEDVRAALTVTDGSSVPVLSLGPVDPTIGDADLIELAGTATQRIAPATAWLHAHAGEGLVCVTGERREDRSTADIADRALRLCGAAWLLRTTLATDADDAAIQRVASSMVRASPTAIVTALEPRLAQALAAELRRQRIDSRRVPTLHLGFEEAVGLEGDLCPMPRLPHEDRSATQSLRTRIASTLVEGEPVGQTCVTEMVLRVDRALGLLASAVHDGGGREPLATAAALRRAADHGVTGTAAVERRGGLWLHPSVVRLSSFGAGEPVWIGDHPIAPSKHFFVAAAGVEASAVERGAQ
jgi:hypothetical protein